MQPCGLLEQQPALHRRRRPPGGRRARRRCEGRCEGRFGARCRHGSRLGRRHRGRRRCLCGRAGPGRRGAGARGRQRRLDRAAHRLVHLARIAEAHLGLGRMHVHVHPLRRDLQEQHIAGLTAAVQHVLVGGAHAVRQQPVAHMAAVDIDVLQVGAGPRGLRQAGAAVHRQRPELQRHLAAVAREGLAEHIAQALLRIARAPLLDQPALVPDLEADLGSRQRMAAHRLQAVRQLGGVGLQELAPRRRREEQLAHLHRRADGARGRLQLAGAAVDALRMRGVHRAAGDRQLGDRADRRQRLAAEAHRHHLLEIVQRADLAGGMAAQRQRQLGFGDALAVVLDDDRAHAAGDQPHRDAGGAGVQRVVDQLAHHRGRALDHLAGGDLADQLVGQLADRAAGGRGQRGGGRGQGHAPDCRKARFSPGTGRIR